MLLLHIFERWAASHVKIVEEIYVRVQNQSDDVEARLNPPAGVMQGSAAVVIYDTQVTSVLQYKFSRLKV